MNSGMQSLMRIWDGSGPSENRPCGARNSTIALKLQSMGFPTWLPRAGWKGFGTSWTSHWVHVRIALPQKNTPVAGWVERRTTFRWRWRARSHPVRILPKTENSVGVGRDVIDVRWRCKRQCKSHNRVTQLTLLVLSDWARFIW